MSESFGNGTVLLSVDGRGVATVTLNRPERNNAYNGDVIGGLLEAFGQLGGDDRAVDPARHRHDDAGLRGGLGKAEGIERLGGKGGHANLHFGSPREYRKIRDTLKTGFHRRLNTSAHARDK